MNLFAKNIKDPIHKRTRSSRYHLF